MKLFKSGSIILIICSIFISFSSCVKVDNTIYERLDNLDQKIDELQNVTIASVSTQVTNIENSIPGIEQTIVKLNEYVTLLKQENVMELSVSRTKIENYIVNLNTQMTEIRTFVQNFSKQETVNNEMWIDITIKTMNLYQSIQNQLSLVKVEITNVKQMISDLKIEVNQKLLEFNTTLLNVINHTEISIMSWVNERFTAYYSIAEVNARIQNMISENNVEINASIQEMNLMVNEMNLKISNLYLTVIEETINYYEGVISDSIIQKIDEATFNLNVSIISINTKITEIENRILIIDNSIDIVNQQIAAINVSIEQMTVLQEQITQYISILEQGGETYGPQIVLLEQVLNELNVKIEELNVYIGSIENNFDTTIIDTKNWVSLTFATIEQYNIINSMIKVVQNSIVEINQNIVNISADITNIQNNVNISITNLDKSTQEWVSENLNAMRDAIDAEFAEFKNELEVLHDMISSTDQTVLNNRMAELEKMVLDIQLRMDESIMKAVEKAIMDYDGNSDAEIMALKKSIDSFYSAMENYLAELYQSVGILEEKIGQIMYDLYESIQSITPIPTYSDGSVAVNSGVVAIEFEIFPILPSQTVNSASFVKYLSFDVLKVQTKAGSPANPLINLPITKAEMSGDFLRVYVDFDKLEKDIYYGEQGLMGRLRFNAGNLFKSSGYFPLSTSTSTSANIVSDFRNKISGCYSASIVAFKYNDNTVTSGTEIQTSDSPEKIYANINGITLTISTPASQIFAPETCDMFCKMDKITSIEFGTGFNTSRVQDMSLMFYGTRSLKSLDLSRFDFSNVSNMRETFSDMECVSLIDFGSQEFRYNMSIYNMCAGLARSINSCTIRCTSFVQKVLSEDTVQLDRSKINWVLTD